MEAMLNQKIDMPVRGMILGELKQIKNSIKQEKDDDKIFQLLKQDKLR